MSAMSPHCHSARSQGMTLIPAQWWCFLPAGANSIGLSLVGIHTTTGFYLLRVNRKVVTMDLRELGFKLKNYRCFDEQWQGFEKTQKVNVIIGRNNSGKSSLLDLVESAVHLARRASPRIG